MLALLLLACTAAPVDTAADGPVSGELIALTYNVAGLPQGLSGSDPIENVPQMSPLLNAYDLVLVQEDFVYHDALVAEAEHPYRSEPAEPVEQPVADGLNRLSVFPFEPVERHRWVACHGTFDSSGDCLSEKGFSVATTTLAPAVTVDVYNHHAEAGGGPGDVAARIAGFEQLLAVLDERSAGRPVILGGDTNLSRSDAEDVPLLDDLLASGALTDACDALDCGVDLIDRFLYRSSDDLELTPLEWRVADEFVTPDGAPLSDHQAVAVRFAWTLER